MNQIPNMGNVGGPPPPGVNAKEALNIPSLLVILMGALGLLSGLASIALYATGGMGSLIHLLKDVPPELRKTLEESASGSVSAYAQIAIGLVASAFSVYGGLQMRAVRSWGLALAASIMVMLPVLSCCCCVGLPIGIWAIVTLVKPEVKAQFT